MNFIRHFGKTLNCQVDEVQRVDPKQKPAKSKRIQIIGQSNVDLEKENSRIEENKIKEFVVKEDTKVSKDHLYSIKNKVYNSNNCSQNEKRSNPQQVELYLDEIYQRMLQKEIELFKKLVDPVFMQRQKMIDESHRLYVIDSMIKTACIYKLKDETLFMAIEIMDAYLSQFLTRLEDVELVSVTALFIASKYEEIYPPSLDRLLLRSSVNKYDVLLCEAKIIHARKFELIGNTTIIWLNFFFDHLESPLQLKDLYDFAKYILEISLLKTQLYQYKSSECALGALALSAKWLKMPSLKINLPEDQLVKEKILRIMSFHLNHILHRNDLFVNIKYKVHAKFLTVPQN